jgi:hypothetical protein
LSLDTTLLGKELLVLTSFSLGLRYVSTRHGRNVRCTMSKQNGNLQRSKARKKSKQQRKQKRQPATHLKVGEA